MSPSLMERDSVGWTPLHYVVYKHRSELARLLLTHGASPDDEGPRGSPLTVAINAGNLDMVQLMWKHSTAVSSNHAHIVEYLLDAGVDAADTSDGWSHILTAGWESVHSLAELQRIERQDASESPDYASTSDVDDSDYDSDNELEELTPEELVRLEYAKRLRTVQQLLLRGADVQSFKPLRTEASPRRVSWNPGYVVKGQTALHLAACNRTPDIVHLLLTHGADPNARNPKGRTPLHRAAYTNDLESIKLLLHHGTDAIATDNQGQTPMHSAATQDDDKLNLSAQNNQGLTALHCAAQDNNVEMVQALLTNGADVHAKSRLGATPLHLCSYTDGKKPMRSLEKTAPEDLAVFQRIRLWPFKEIERADLAAFLLKHGANPSIKNHQGDSPADLAVVCGDPKLADALKVAIFVAYVGSAFRGLQIQRDQPGGTVEDVLQAALDAAGCILPSNFGNLQKIGWSRSSRTDKGVHALANVVAMKLECNPESFKTDPEGSQLASDINQHLPAEVQVLSVQRVNSGFNARSYCNTRTYHYYLPASILGLALDGSTVDDARMGLLRQCCSLFEGRHPFHNYTKRRLYRIRTTDTARGASRDVQQAAQRAAESNVSDSPAEQDTHSEAQPSASAGDETSTDSNSLQEWEAIESPQDSSSSGKSGASIDLDSTQEAEAAMQPALIATPRPLQYSWLDEMDPRDRLAPAHYRHINCILADDPITLGNGATSAVKVSITGSSFMLYQIRHMLGAAVAVARGDLPLDFVSASLCAPARAVLPLAPAQVLVLAGNAFQPFPSDGLGVIQSLSGSHLQLGAKGQAARDSFAQQVLHPAIEDLFKHEVWAQWDNDLKRTTWQDNDFTTYIQKAEHWQVQRAAIASAKQEQLSSAAVQ
ncbi:hypothetical protein WJX82_007559 [Trebouxia sp. C0006]